jgi:cyclase
MLRKRIIFTLLYDSGQFMLSRNFRLQKVGDIGWLEKNYNFSHIAFSIDELIVLDVSRGQRNFNDFCECLKRLTQGCFVPISAGGGIRNVKQAKELLRSGADKIVVNTPVFNDQEFIFSLASEFGKQCVVASLDLKKTSNEDYIIMVENGTKALEGEIREKFERLKNLPVGEIYLNSMDRDGTGQGYDVNILHLLPEEHAIPIIMAGGVGNSIHLAEGLKRKEIDAVATAHLFNFVGDGLERARKDLLAQGNCLAVWSSIDHLLAKQVSA